MKRMIARIIAWIVPISILSLMVYGAIIGNEGAQILVSLIGIAGGIIGIIVLIAWVAKNY